jgi:hypothetical protein
MCDFHEQRIREKLRLKLGKSFTETFEMLRTEFGNEALGRTQTHESWKRLKDGRTSTENDPRSRLPSVSKTDEIVAKVKKVISSNCRLTVREVAEEASISRTVCLESLTQNFGLSRIEAKFVPRPLTY